MEAYSSRYFSNNDFTRLPPFTYDGIHLDGPSIRLIRLLKSPRADKYGEIFPIQCELKLAYLGSRRENYDAVSYAWGGGKRTQTIKLSGKAFQVSPVVGDILLRLRHERQDRLLWIDLICIDQDNAVEKAIQVKRMKDIFGEAQTVIASLGPHSEFGLDPIRRDPRPRMLQLNTRSQEEPLDPVITYPPLKKSAYISHGDEHKAMELLTSIWDPVTKFFRLSQRDEERILGLLSKPWFDRVWVVQEVAVARKLLVVCGDKEIEGKCFARLHGRMQDRIRGEKLKVRLQQLLPLLEYISADSVENYDKPELLTLLQRFRPWKATDPHDKVYALLGLSKDGPKASELAPDYKLPIATLYERVAAYMLVRYNSLAVLTYVGSPLLRDNATQETWLSWFQAQLFSTYSQHLPSWCPDWRDPYIPLKPEPVSMSGTLIERGTKDSLLFDRIATFDAYIDSDSTLIVSGFILAFVASTPHGSFDVGLPPTVKESIKDVPGTCHQISQHLQSLNASSSKPPAQLIQAGDQICVLDHCTGIAILRASGEKFKMVMLEHSDFAPVRLDPIGASLRATLITESIYGSIIRQLLTGRNGKVTRPVKFSII